MDESKMTSELSSTSSRRMGSRVDLDLLRTGNNKTNPVVRHFIPKTIFSGADCLPWAPLILAPM